MLPGLMPMPGLHGSVGIGGNDAFTELLLHMDGVDASTSFPDASSNGLSVTVGGNAQVDTAQSKFGGASALFDGTGDYIKTPASAALNMGTGNFTIDFWVRATTTASDPVLFKIDSGTASNGLAIAAGKLQWWKDGVGAIVTGATSLSTNTWHHVAIVRSGSTLTAYLNGTSDGSGSLSDSMDFSSWRIADGYYGADLSGWIDEFRISSTARWTANFTPPAYPYS